MDLDAVGIAPSGGQALGLGPDYVSGFLFGGSGVVARQQHAAGGPDAAKRHDAGLGITLVGEIDGALGSGDTEGVDQVEVVFLIEVRQSGDAEVRVATLNEANNRVCANCVWILLGR